MIKFVGDLRQVDGFLQVLLISSTNKTDCYNITEILLKVALNTITLTVQLRLNLNNKFVYIIPMFHTYCYLTK
jgi:hypothetical protein